MSWDTLQILVELGGRMASENAVGVPYLLQEGLVTDDGYDDLGRRMIRITDAGKGLLQPPAFEQPGTTAFPEGSLRFRIKRNQREMEYSLQPPTVIVGHPVLSHADRWHFMKWDDAQGKATISRADNGAACQIQRFTLVCRFSWQGWDPASHPAFQPCYHKCYLKGAVPCGMCGGAGRILQLGWLLVWLDP